MPRIDHASRTINAPQEAVFDAFLTEDAVAQWLPPKGAKASFEAFDPRPGGDFKMTLVFETGGKAKRKTTPDSDTVNGEFLSIDYPNSIVQQFAFQSDDRGFAGVMTMSWLFSKSGGGTRVEVSASDVPKGISPGDHQRGMNSSLENLAAYVESKHA